MTKRTQNNDDKSNNKRPKLNDDLEELWGDELDESVLEDCIKLASQVINEDQNRENDSFLSTYDVFKVPPRPMFSSTQINSSIGPTTSKDSNAHFTQSRNGSESEIQRLKMQCAEKDGEVAILRTQLRETKAQSNIEFIKTSSEWKAKLSLSEKQVQAIKSELEFKNLEIANLKQKILGLSRHSLNKTFSNDDTPDIKASCSKETLAISPRRNEVKKLYATTNIDFPLKKTWTNSFLSISKTEKFIINNKLFHSFNNGIPYLQNKTVSTRVILNTNKADVHSIYPIILKVCELTELGSESYISDINTIICVGLQSLEDLLELLQEIKKNLRTEDLLEVDSLYLIDEDINCDYKSDLGRRAAFVLNFLAALLPYSSYLKNYFIHNKLLDLRKQVDLIKNIPCISTKKAHSGQDFLNKLVSILNVAGEIRKANVMSTFLKASIKLFNNICKLNGYTRLSQTVCKFTKEMIFSRPLVNVTFELTYLLKEVSRHTTFVQYLLNKSNGTTNTKNGILRFNEDACRFYIFVFLFHRSLSKKRTVPPEICLNILSFIYNTYKFSYFLHHVDVKECKCLQQLYKLVIELIFRTLETYTEEIKLNNRPSDFADFFNSKIVLNVLNLMSFHRYELIEKYMTLYSQFKEIERMLSENEVCDLGRLNINEDIPEIDSQSFENIGF